MKRILALALGLCLWAAPGLAAITQIAGTGTGSSVSNVTYSGGVSPLNNDPSVAIPAGSLAVAVLQTYDTSPTLSCSDAFGNTWQSAPNGAFRANAGVQIWYSFTAFTIPQHGNIPCTSSAPAQFTGQILAFAGTASSPYDVSPTGTTGSGTSVTVGPSPTLSCPGGGAGCEVCVAAAIWNSAGTITPDATWTDTNNSLSGASWANGFKIVNASTALSFTSSTSATAANAGAMACFKSAASAATRHNGILLGVGP